MIGKLCSPPKGGGDACGLIEYLVGYAIAEKGATREEIIDALEVVYAEAEARADLGIDCVWSPSVGGGTRPSSILVRNCASFSTASLEIDADAARNPGVRTSAMHFVWSWNTRESGMLSDAQVHGFVEQVLAKLNLSHHRMVAVVHRDTILYQRDIHGSIQRDERGNPVARAGNLHVHCAVGAVDPRVGLAYDRTSLHRRMAWAEREVEVEHRLNHDRGLAIVQDAGLATAHVRWADKHELAAWRTQRREERLLRQERRSFEGYRQRDVTFQRYVDATVAPRLQIAIDLARQRGRRPDWATLHAVAARYGCELDQDTSGNVVVRDVGTGELRVQHQRERRDLRERLLAEGVDVGDVDDNISALRSEHEHVEAAERDQRRALGETVRLADVLKDDLLNAQPYQDLEAAEQDLIDRMCSDPAAVLSELTAQSSTFTREDVDLWLTARISDPAEVERLGDSIARHDSVRALTLDTVQSLMTTTEVLDVEERLQHDASALAISASLVTDGAIETAIELYEMQESSRRNQPFRLSPEQRTALHSLSRARLAVMEGLPGVGKTTIQGVIRFLGEQTGLAVVGLTLSQAAAERLEFEAGFPCVNTARARILEEGKVPVIPRGGIVVVDEAAMVDSRANGRILELARERGSMVVEIGDLRQLQPIDFGASFRILRDIAQSTGTHVELKDIVRQRRDWHKEAVTRLADAIAERDDRARVGMVREALDGLERHGAITWAEDRDTAIDIAVEHAQQRRAAGYDTLTLASDRDTVRHLSEEDRRRNGLAGQGRGYTTEFGVREFAVGDRLMFLDNSLGRRGLGVRNGDRGTVVELQRDRISVELEGNKPRLIHFAPSKYTSFDYANACTVHKAQGASVDAVVSVIDGSASAELLFVAASRSKHAVDLVVPRSAFQDMKELSEHIAGHITLKTTTLTYDELLQKTGGKRTMRVLNMEAQNAADPLRRLYEAEVVEPLRALQKQQIETARVIYSERTEEVRRSSLSIEEKLEVNRDALRVMRRSVATTYARLKAQPFGDWLEQREQARERLRQLHEARTRDLDQSQHRDRDRADFGPFLRADRSVQDTRYIER